MLFKISPEGQQAEGGKQSGLQPVLLLQRLNQCNPEKQDKNSEVGKFKIHICSIPKQQHGRKLYFCLRNLALIRSHKTRRNSSKPSPIKINQAPGVNGVTRAAAPRMTRATPAIFFSTVLKSLI